jgi:hypothetical protein
VLGLVHSVQQVNWVSVRSVRDERRRNSATPPAYKLYSSFSLIQEEKLRIKLDIFF